MPTSESTCWTVIRGAAAGDRSDRAELARRYLSVVRAYLAARWEGSPLLADLDDAGQDVFVECFRQGGVLDAAAAGRVGSFRAFLYGVVRNVARRFESRPVHAAALPSDLGSSEDSQSRLFDRTWARSLMVEAAGLQRQRAARARRRGDPARRAAPAAVRGEPADPHDRPTLGRSGCGVTSRVCPGPPGVQGGPARGSGLSSPRQPSRGRAGGGRAAASAFLNFFRIFSEFPRENGPSSDPVSRGPAETRRTGHE